MAIDFANSIRSAQGEGDGVASWNDLVLLFVALGVSEKNQAEPLVHLAAAAPKETAGALAAALELRGAIRTCLEARVLGKEIEADWIAPINGILRWTEGYDQLVPEAAKVRGRSWRMEFVVRERRLEWLLAAIARSAAELIAEGTAAPIRKCGNPSCPMFFYDTSRTGRRRWCSMAVCGNRNKVAEHARRARRAERQGTN